jgi:hypothetical protein
VTGTHTELDVQKVPGLRRRHGAQQYVFGRDALFFQVMGVSANASTRRSAGTTIGASKPKDGGSNNPHPAS